MDSQEIGPSRGYYGLAVVVVVAGFGLFGVTLWKGLSGMGTKLQQVVAPGRAEITLAEPGDYTIFYEHQSVMGNRVYSTGDSVPGLECMLVSKSSGSPVELRRSGVNSTYSFGGRSGKSVFDFHIDQPGVYEIASGYPEGHEGEEVVLAIGKGIATDILVTIFGGLAVVFGSIALAVAIAVITAVKRQNAQKRLQSAGGTPAPIE